MRIEPADNSESVWKGGANRLLDRESFIQYLDLEVKRSMRYQNFFCLLVLKLNPVSLQEGGKALQSCYQTLAQGAREELRESDVIGSLEKDRMAALLPYADLTTGGTVKTRMEESLRYYDFKREGFEVSIDQVSFPMDGTETIDLLQKVMGKSVTALQETL